MRKTINIALDLETLSRRTTAAIIGIAAKAFSLGEDKVKGEAKFFQGVDATTCAMLGLDIDPDTVKWWSEKSQQAKEQFGYNHALHWALSDLCDFVKKVKEENEADEVHVWCQGTDFDIAVIRNAFVVANNDRAEKTIPWKYVNVRDSRTFIFEGIRLLYPNVEDPYSVIPKKKDWVEHDAMSDCDQLIHNVTWVNERLTERLNPNPKANEQV